MPPKDDFTIYFELLKQAVTHLDQRLDGFQTRFDKMSDGMSSLEKALQDTRLLITRIEGREVNPESITLLQDKVYAITTVQDNCPGRRFLRWTTIMGLITVMGLCAGVFFQWKEVRQMRLDNKGQVEQLVREHLGRLSGTVAKPKI